MNLKRSFWILLPLLNIAFSAKSQYSELGIFGGLSGYAGDLTVRALTLDGVKEGYGFFYRYNANAYFNFRLQFTGGRVSGSDAFTPKNYENATFHLERNLSFRSWIGELALIPEWNILGYEPYNLHKPISPYLFAGIGLFRYNPKAYYEGDWITLQPLGTEGQGMDGFSEPYSRLKIAIPFGIGVKYAINDLWNIGLEYNARYTFTDYLDDVSTTYVARPELIAGNGVLSANLANRTGEYFGTEAVSLPTGSERGNPETNDWYGQFVVMFSYNFMDNGLVGFRRRTVRKNKGCRNANF